jgi:glycosyltransferase EpsE
MHVTVLMAVYNGAGTVKMAVESILRQTYQDWEFLIVDDASTDETPKILGELASQEERVRLICNPKNRGMAASLNVGWKQARSRLIARIDADDVCFRDRLAKQVEFMDQHPEVAVLGTGAELIDEKGNILGVALRPEQHEVLAKRIYKENPFIHPTVMIRRDFLESLGGYDERLRRIGDFDLWLRGYRRFHFHNLPLPLVRYRLRNKPILSDIFLGAFAMMKGAFREGYPITRSWYVLRLIAAGLLTKMGLYSSCLRPVTTKS